MTEKQSDYKVIYKLTRTPEEERQARAALAACPPSYPDTRDERKKNWTPIVIQYEEDITEPPQKHTPAEKWRVHQAIEQVEAMSVLFTDKDGREVQLPAFVWIGERGGPFKRNPAVLWPDEDSTGGSNEQEAI